jgi:hypothetical protein
MAATTKGQHDIKACMQRHQTMHAKTSRRAWGATKLGGVHSMWEHPGGVQSMWEHLTVVAVAPSDVAASPGDAAAFPGDACCFPW